MARDVINDKVYILYAENYDNFRYYISNTNPVMWDKDINNAKTYMTSSSAEFAILGDYYNYRDVKKQKDVANIRKLYVGEFNDKGYELRRVDII